MEAVPSMDSLGESYALSEGITLIDQAATSSVEFIFPPGHRIEVAAAFVEKPVRSVLL